MSKNVITLKSGSEVIKGHLKWYHSIECLRFPINFVPVRRAVFEIFDL